MTTYFPVLNGIYGMNGNFANPKLNYDNESQYTNNNKKNEVKEIINCINVNFENLLLLISGTNNLYKKETEKNNKNMVNIDDNLDSLFCSLKNLNENINDLSVRMEKIESHYQENFMEKMKQYTGEQVNSLRLDLGLIYGDILKLFDESAKQKKEKNVVLDVQYNVHSISCEADIAQEVELSIDFEVFNCTFVDDKDRNIIEVIELECDENIIDINYKTKKKNTLLPDTNCKIDLDKSDHVICDKINKKKRKRKKKKGRGVKTKPPDDILKFKIYYHDIFSKHPSKNKIRYHGNCWDCGWYGHRSEDCLGYDLAVQCDKCNGKHPYEVEC